MEDFDLDCNARAHLKCAPRRFSFSLSLVQFAFFLILSLFYSLFFAFSILCVCFNLFFLFDILLLRSFDRMLSSASRRNRVALECGWQVEYRQSIVATEMTCGIVSLIFLILANNKKEFSFFCFPNLLSTMEFEIFEFHRSRVTGRPAGTGSC